MVRFHYAQLGDDVLYFIRGIFGRGGEPYISGGSFPTAWGSEKVARRNAKKLRYLKNIEIIEFNLQTLEIRVIPFE